MSCRDATDLEVLQLWLDEFLDAECTNEVFEVQEQFAFGISAELTRLRTAEKVSKLRSQSLLLISVLSVLYDIGSGNNVRSSQVSANTRATAAAVGERTRSAAAVASQQVPAIPCNNVYLSTAVSALCSTDMTMLASIY